MAGDIFSLTVALVCCALWVVVLRDRQHHFRQNRPSATATRQRLLKPRPPANCPECCQEALSSSAAPPPPFVRPWRELKSRRGAPKRVATAGFSCPNHACSYYGSTDPQIHALVGDGTHGKIEPIQTFHCQACGTTFTARRDTPLYRVKTPSTRVAEVLSALAEGLTVAAAVRVFGHRHDHDVAHAGRCTQCDLARPLVPPALSPPSPAGRTAHAIARSSARPLVVGGHRPTDETDPSRASRGTDAAGGAWRRP